MTPIKFDYSSMMTLPELVSRCGFKRIGACSAGANGDVRSYIAYARNGQRIYGYYNYQTARYDEQPAPRP